MKKLLTLWYRLTMRDFDNQIESAKITYKMIMASTKGNINHFYNEYGEQVRGYYTPVKKFHHVHPLLEKYL